MCICLDPSSIYSCCLSHILEHEIFCFGRFGSQGSKEKIGDLSFSEQLLRVIFLTFGGQKNNLNIFKKHISNRTEKLHKMKLIFF